MIVGKERFCQCDVILDLFFDVQLGSIDHVCPHDDYTMLVADCISFIINGLP